MGKGTIFSKKQFLSNFIQSGIAHHCTFAQSFDLYVYACPTT